MNESSIPTAPVNPHRWAYWVAGGLVMVLVLISLLVVALSIFGPDLAKKALIEKASQSLNRVVSIETVDIKLFALEAEIRGFSVSTLDGKQEQLGAGRLWAKLTPLNLTKKQLSAEVKVEQLRWQDNAGKPLLAIKTLQVPISQADLAQHQITVGEVLVEGVRGQVQRNPKGQISSLLALDDLLNSLPKPPAPTEPETPIRWSVSQLMVRDADIQFTDHQTPGKSTASQAVHIHQLTLQGLNQSLSETLPLTLDARLNQAGILNVHGQALLKPFVSTELQFEVKDLPLKPAQPYIENALDLTLQGGGVDAEGKLKLAMPPNQPINIQFVGDVVVKDFASSDSLLKEPFLSWKKLAVQGIDLKLGEEKETIILGKVQLDDFFARLIVSPGGELNVLKVVRQQAASPGNKPAAPKSAVNGPTVAKSHKADPLIRIDEVAFHRGRVLFSDRFIKPNYTARIEQVGGHIRGLSSLRNELAEMALSGRYNQVAPVHVTARLNLLADQRFLDLTAKVKGIEMTSFNPYAGHYAGYNIEKGKLSLDLSYKLEGQALKAENRVFLDQLTFGDKVDSPNATSLPVRLAVALLKNRKGEIDINLPISGSLDDPQFSIGGILWQVIGNLIVKAVAAPFSLIASLFDSTDDLSSLDFVPGLATLREADHKRLDTIATALREKPTLHLEITGWADPVADEAALRADKTRKRPVDAAALQQLAQRRAQAVQLWFIEKGQIPAERVFLLPGKVSEAITPSDTPKSAPSTPSASRVDFSLR